MPALNRSAIVPHPREAMFELVDRVEDYPLFLPWCPGVRGVVRTPEYTSARIDIAWRGLETHVATRNRKHAPESIHLELVDGPFRSFSGAWRFAALGAEGCRVEFGLEYAFASRALDVAMGPLFSQIMATVVDRFVERAAEVAGR